MRLRWSLNAWVIALAAMAASEAHGQEGEELFEALQSDRITLSVEEVRLSEFLKLISRAHQLNIVAGPEVDGVISLNLYDVPFRDALDHALAAAGYVAVRSGNVLYVVSESNRSSIPGNMSDTVIRTYRPVFADPDEIMDILTEFLSPAGTILVAANGTVILRDAPEYMDALETLYREIDSPPDDIHVLEINYVQAEDLVQVVAPFLSSRGTASSTPDGHLIVRDQAANVAAIRSMVSQIDVAPRQVLIRSRILTVTHDDDLTFGVEWSGFFTNSSGEDSGAFTQGFVPDLGAPSTFDSLSGFFATMVRDHESVLLRTLQDLAEVEVLAAPELLVLDGEQAQIQVGDRLGFRITTTTETASLESVEFLDVGTLLEVTPTIGSENLIRLDVHPEVSTGDVSADGLPSERTTEATTSLMVEDGRTVVIGGLVNLNKVRSRSQVPVLGDIPVVGLLFGTRRKIDMKSELIILLTPRLVGPRGDAEMDSRIRQVDLRQRDIDSYMPDAEPRKGQPFVWGRPFDKPAAETDSAGNAAVEESTNEQ